MSRILKRFPLFTETTPKAVITLSNALIPLHDLTDLVLLGQIRRDHFCGGTREFDGSATGSFSLPGAIPITIDNQNNQLSNFTDTGGGVLKVQFRFRLYVSNSAINVTPKLYDLTSASYVTTSGASACSQTDQTFTADATQKQTLTFTLPNAKHVYEARLTIAGTTAPGYTVYGDCSYDCYVEL